MKSVSILFFALLLGTSVCAADTLRLPALRLRDAQGALQRMQPGNGGTVVVLLAPDCPLCKNYAPALRELQQQLPDVKMYGIVPGKAYTPAMVQEYARQYGISFPLLLDDELAAAKALKGIATPEAFFFSQRGALVYRGLIDDRMAGLGKKRRVVTERYLENAILRNRAGLAVTNSRTEPIGCLINDY
ncbi:redoxin domain-containing protein [Chitinophaga pollutisoli]|uniref:Redoxin domain-containing protein n=1 Tax=Chitinophaga pollutisoli TaxID=3133966 RepID=A0ABZ2YKZ9_9BACT